MKITAKEKNRIKIMHTAKSLFEIKGIDNVTMGEIATACSMCRATVFNHFSSVDELLYALSEQEINDIISYCNASNKKGIALIRAMFHMLIEDTAYYPNLSTRLLNHMLLSQKSNKTVISIESIIVNQLANEQPSAKLSLDYSAIIISGLYYGLVNHYHANNIPFDKESMCNEFDQILNQLL